MTEQVLPDLNGQYALITGASRGIGARVAVACAKAGAHVVLLARTIGALEAIDDEIQSFGGQATILPQDLTQLNMLDKLGPTLAERFGALDIFIGNAGVLGALGPLTHVQTREWDRILTTNFQANFRLIRTLDPLLQAAKNGRALFTASGRGERPKAYWGTYGISKAAMQMMVKIYAAENEKTALNVNMVDPGVVDTALLEQAFPGGYQGDSRDPEDVVPAFMSLLSPGSKKNGEIIMARDYL